MINDKPCINKPTILILLILLFSSSYSCEIYQIEIPSEYLTEDNFNNEDIDIIEYDEQYLKLAGKNSLLSHEKRFYSLGNVIIGVQIHVIENTEIPIPDLELITKYNKYSYSYIPVGLKCSIHFKSSLSKISSIKYKIFFQIVDINTWTKIYNSQKMSYETIIENTKYFSNCQSECKDNRYTTNINRHLHSEYNDII
ncbi:MAG: hypothetical protein HRT87_11930 [Legionellales bacterium]|nr:hypothetical protein [Legionellales bacterium]